MIKNNAIITGFVILVAIASGNVLGEIKVYSQIDSKTDVYVGEKFNFYVVIDGDNQPGQVDLSPLARFKPQNAGNRDLSQSMTTIINGKRTDNVTKRYLMAYQLDASEQGREQIPSVTVTVNGQIYQTNPVEVNILRPGTTDQLDLDIGLSDQQCYVGQPVIMTVNFYISADIGDFNFNIPAFGNSNFELDDPDVHGKEVKAYELANGVRVLVSQERVTHNGKNAILLSFSKALLPKQPGDLVIPEASVSANVAVGRSPSQDPFDGFFAQKQYKRFVVTAKPLSLKVLPLPQAAKPVLFYGLIGQYTIFASATPTEVSVGEPITLTIKIGGNSYLKPVKWPELENIPELSANFQIPSEKSSPALDGGFKIFTQTIRASSDKVTTIPPIPLAFFDPQQEKYTVVQTEPIRLKVSPTKILTAADTQGPRAVQANNEVEAVKSGLSANYEDIDALTNQNLSTLGIALMPTYITLWAIPLLALVASVLFKILTFTTPEKQAQKRRQAARVKALRQLKNLLDHSAGKNHEQIASILKQYVGERFDKNACSLTAEDCRQIICQTTEDTKTAEEYQDIVAACEAASYAPISVTVDSAQIASAIELITAIDKKAAL